jgi:ethanolamine utilization protein EutP (predicted NTPase)
MNKDDINEKSTEKTLLERLNIKENVKDTINNVWNYVGKKNPENAINIMGHEELIQIGDYIQDIFRDSDILDPPTLCVIGSQSSGKSSVLNSLKGIDILPKGKTIVTRTPIHERLIYVKNSKNITVEFFSRNDLQKVISSFTMDANNVLEEDLEPIRNEITRLTNKYAGKSKDVVNIPINIKIKSPHVPSLSIIDLPGLTNIALTDKGQSENIKFKIEDMLIKYIKNPRSIILSIIPATIDVESDMGLGLIKKYDPEFKRTIGVITKIDLLKDSNVVPYLSGNISKSLQLGYGYYAIRNRSSDECKKYSVIQGYDLEKNFFTENKVYNDCEYKSTRMGSINLGNKLSEILISHLRSTLPNVLEEIKIKEKETDDKLDEIGRVQLDEMGRRTLLNVLLHEFQSEYSSAIKDRGSRYNTGSRIADSFRKFSSQLNKLEHFNKNIYTDKLINEIVRDYNGIHMEDITISIGVIEKCFQGIDIYLDNVNNDNNKKKIKKYCPMDAIKELFSICIKEIQIIMCELIDTILKRDRYSRFPKLCVKIKELITSMIIPQKYEITCGKIFDVFIEEKECIWTDDVKFRSNVLPKIFHDSNNGTIEPAVIRTILSEYYKVIKNMCNHRIHKTIRTFFVNRVVDDINTTLTDHILLKTNINKLLEENQDKVKKREKLLKIKEKIEQVKKIIIDV